MSDFLLDEALRFEGFTDAQIAQIESDLPIISQLVDLYTKNRVSINQAMLLVDKLSPTIKTIATVLQKRTQP